MCTRYISASRTNTQHTGPVLRQAERGRLSSFLAHTWHTPHNPTNNTPAPTMYPRRHTPHTDTHTHKQTRTETRTPTYRYTHNLDNSFPHAGAGSNYSVVAQPGLTLSNLHTCKNTHTPIHTCIHTLTYPHLHTHTACYILSSSHTCTHTCVHTHTCTSRHTHIDHLITYVSMSPLIVRTPFRTNPHLLPTYAHAHTPLTRTTHPLHIHPTTRA
jgi:hypothetical protein